MKKFTVITFSGGPGAGKTTLIRKLISSNNDLIFARTTTTRSPRPDDLLNEINFVSQKNFFLMEDAKKFLWTSSVHEQWYGTETTYFGREGSMVLCDIAPSAIANVRSTLYSVYANLTLFSCYIYSPKISTLRLRLEARGDEKGLIEKKISQSKCWDDDAKSDKSFDLYMMPASSVEERISLLKSKISLR